MPRVAGAEGQRAFSVHHRAAQTQGHGDDAVLGLHRGRRIEVVRARHPRDVGIEAAAVRDPDHLLDDHRHLLFFEAVRRDLEVVLGVLREGGGVDPLDRASPAAAGARPGRDGCWAACRSSRRRPAAGTGSPRAGSTSARPADSGSAPGTRPGRARPRGGRGRPGSAARSPRRRRCAWRSRAGRCRSRKSSKTSVPSTTQGGTVIWMPGKRVYIPKVPSRWRTKASARALPPSEPSPMRAKLFVGVERARDRSRSPSSRLCSRR